MDEIRQNVQIFYEVFFFKLRTTLKQTINSTYLVSVEFCQPSTFNWNKISRIVFSAFMLNVAWKRRLPRNFARFVLFRPIKKRPFNPLCVLDRKITTNRNLPEAMLCWTQYFGDKQQASVCWPPQPLDVWNATQKYVARWRQKFCLRV